MNQETFLRYEQKYILSKDQMKKLIDRMNEHIRPDRYPEYELHNIYFDTDDDYLISHCLQKPLYREKLRLRCYGEPANESPCYLELKKKFRSFGNKRRIQLTLQQGNDFLQGQRKELNGQIGREIEDLVNRHPVTPKIFIRYQRRAFCEKENCGLRITFDDELMVRKQNICLAKSELDESLLKNDQVIMEIKAPETMPLWLVHELTEMRITPVSFSKYSAAHQYFN